MTDLGKMGPSPRPKRGTFRAADPAMAGLKMCVNKKEFDELIGALDRSLAIFGDRPADPGFDLAVYEELRRVRETLIRARRDMRDPNTTRPKRDSKSPLGSS